MEKAFREQTRKKNFADTYPTGERLKWLLATPPYMWDQPSADRKAGSSQTFGGKSLDRKLHKRKEDESLACVIVATLAKQFVPRLSEIANTWNLVAFWVAIAAAALSVVGGALAGVTLVHSLS